MFRRSATLAAAALTLLAFLPASSRAAEIKVHKGEKEVTLDVPKANVDHRGLKSLGWKLSCQMYTFREYSAFETLDILHAMGFNHCELYPGQRLSPDKPKVHIGPDMSDEDLAALKAKLKDVHITPENYGVCPLPNDEAQARKTFEFAKKLGLATIVSEPPEDAFPMLNKLVEEYKINVAIHNHPKPSHYWNCDTVLKVTEGLSPRIGSCSDVGHWVRSGLNPVECIKKLGSRVITLHFKDVVPVKPGEDGFGGYGDVPWGQGQVNVPAVLTQLKEQGFKGTFSVEYERSTGQDLVNNVEKSITNFSGYVTKLAAGEPIEATASNSAAPQAEQQLNTLTDQEKAEGWKLLFNGKDTSGFHNFKKEAGPLANFKVIDGILSCYTRGPDIVTDEQFANFVLEVDWRVPQHGNSGIIYRCDESKPTTWLTGVEYQLYDDGTDSQEGLHDAAAAYDLYPPTAKVCKPAGEWNHTKLVVDGNHVEHWLNGVKVVEYEFNSPDFNERVGKSKFHASDKFGKLTKGNLAFQGDHTPGKGAHTDYNVQFRNMKIRELPEKSAGAN